MYTILKPKLKGDALLVCDKILTYFNVQHTRTSVNRRLEDHLDYPSLLCITDTLSDYGIESAAIRKGTYSYAEFEAPFVCSIQQEDWGVPSFTVVSNVDSERVTYLDPITAEKKSVAIVEFEQMDKEVVLLLDGDGKKDETNYNENRKAERTAGFVGLLPFFVPLLSVILPGIYLATTAELTIAWPALIFLVTGGIGLVSSVLLLWHEVDAHNPFLKEVCGGQGRKLNCNAVLQSSGAKFLGISWSTWGFAYFSTFFLCQVLFPQQLGFLGIWSLLSLAVSPYMLYSLYYQWQVVRQWCPLCLSVQGVLLVNALVAVATLSAGPWPEISWYSVATVFLLGVGTLLATYYFIPLARQAKDSRLLEKKWKRLRYSPDVFQSLLEKSNGVTLPAEGLGLVVGNPDATHEIIKVCNPYCGPCSRAHPELEGLLKTNKDLRLRIIFTATGADEDMKTAPVAHLLAIDEKYGTRAVHKALDDWYLAEEKDYKIFAAKYPMNGELKSQSEKMKAMSAWCDAMKIRATPTVFIDGRELPESYRIDELKNFF